MQRATEQSCNAQRASQKNTCGMHRATPQHAIPQDGACRRRMPTAHADGACRRRMPTARRIAADLDLLGHLTRAQRDGVDHIVELGLLVLVGCTRRRVCIYGCEVCVCACVRVSVCACVCVCVYRSNIIYIHTSIHARAPRSRRLHAPPRVCIYGSEVCVRACACECVCVCVCVSQQYNIYIYTYLYTLGLLILVGCTRRDGRDVPRHAAPLPEAARV
jgi:hypothetical protein